MIGGSGGLPVNPFAVSVSDMASPPYGDIKGKSRVAAALVGGQTTAVLLAIGQSKPDNSVIGDSYATVHATNHNFSWLDGACYASAGGLLGNSIPSTSGLFGASYLTRLADKIITGGSNQRVILVPAAVGSSSIVSWASGGIYANRYAVIQHRLAARGLTVSHVLWDQGETDAINGMAAATYTTHLQSVRSLLTAAGISAPLYVARAALHPSATAGNQTAVRTGQTNAVDGTTIRSGPDLDAIGNRDASLVHFNATGSDGAASAWKTSLEL